MNLIFFILILFLSFPIDVFGFFRSRTKIRPIVTKDCCIPPKINIDSKKANHGRDFFRQLTINSDLYDEVNPENMCHLMHFLFQQASINNKSILFTEGIFIIFDSSNQILDRLIKYRQTPHEFNFRDSDNSRKSRNVNEVLLNKEMHKRINGILHDRYPTYGMDIPGSCLPNNFDQIIFGELPTFVNDYKYNGRRIFIKPDRFGFEKTKISSALNDVNSFIKQIAKQEFCRLIKKETKSECAKLRAFNENTEKILLRKWKNILSTLPSKWKIDKQYKERAIKYGIREIDQQSKHLEAYGAGKKIKEFRKLLIKIYGEDDLRVRKGREIIFTINQLKQTYSTCQSSNDIKCIF